MNHEYDECDREVAESHKWVRRYDGYIYRMEKGDGKSKTIYFHRQVMNAPIGMTVDHIDGDRSNNRRANLRLVSHAENIRNRTGLSVNNTSGYRGVSLMRSGKRIKRWFAQAKLNGKTHMLGYFHTPEEAAAKAAAWRLKNMPGALN